ncbi:MAG: acetylornithine deacetylase [Pseudomonadota bacterium]
MPDTYSPREMIERLIAFDTTSAGSNLELIAFVEDYLAGHGVASRRSSGEAKKANLFATVGPEVEGGVVLSGHTDVVPVANQAWVTDPFQVVEQDGKLYGRGTSDMKSFLAIALALVPRMLEAGIRVPLHLALSYDEEVGCLGVRSMIADIETALPAPRAVLVGEPTSMKLVNAHKGINAFVTRVTGKEAHSSQTHRSASAIMAAARLIGHLEQVAAEKRENGPFDERFEPPHTTVSVGTFEGGTALNIVPRHAHFVWEYRLLPGDDGAAIEAGFRALAEDHVLPSLRATAPEADIVTETISAVPPLRPESDSPAEDLVRHLSGTNLTDAVSFGTEGGLFQDAGFSTVVCGPGSIDQAHQPNEFIELSQVAACEDFLRKLIDWAANPA